MWGKVAGPGARSLHDWQSADSGPNVHPAVTRGSQGHKGFLGLSSGHIGLRHGGMKQLRTRWFLMVWDLRVRL